ncbi:MAG: thioredoxin domain-containing protein [Candidatus Kapabacteria bacterium]|nr:thioredoxin domain-containing protein [Candidatus Kapabacteria bacterium]
MNENYRSNKLAAELSPYLLQHKHNPVDWYPWSEEAFDKAKSENKPIFLSIGYSTCHWCHVMERESFEDAEVAKLMNDTFVNIKVDREERPDVDHIYMTVCQMMTGAGGWPLTILMTPEGKPFYAGTYFPKYSRGERPGIIDLINRTKEVWQTHQAELSETANDISQQLQNMLPTTDGAVISENIFRKAFHELAGTYDEFYGGFGTRPKFPVPHNLLFLMKHYRRSNNEEALQMVVNTLTRMRLGGIYDHVGFGFHRYSTDAKWFLPHFEKMLYDQAMLLNAYSEAYLQTKNELFRKTAYEIIEYINRDLLSPEGAYFSAEDADSEGEEGKFYVWDIEEIREHLIGNVELISDIFGIEESGNFLEEATREKNGKNILSLKDTIAHFAKSRDLNLVELNSKLENIRQILLAERSKRIRPHLDDKILTDWNGLITAALANAGKIFADEEFIGYAERTYSFIKSQMFTPDGGLHHRFRDGIAGIDGMIDDYAYTISALLELFSATAKSDYLADAVKLTDYLIEHFQDPKGGFYFTSDLAEKLIVRKKEIYDGAIPSGNSIMLANLVKLSKITGNTTYIDIADKATKAFAGSVTSAPSAYTSFLIGFDSLILQNGEIVIVGTEPRSDFMKALFAELKSTYIVIVKTPENSLLLGEHLKNNVAIDGKITAYICNNFTCSEPIRGEEEILAKIREL